MQCTVRGEDAKTVLWILGYVCVWRGGFLWEVLGTQQWELLKGKEHETQRVKTIVLVLILAGDHWGLQLEGILEIIWYSQHICGWGNSDWNARVCPRWPLLCGRAERPAFPFSLYTWRRSLGRMIRALSYCVLWSSSLGLVSVKVSTGQKGASPTAGLAWGLCKDFGEVCVSEAQFLLWTWSSPFSEKRRWR